MKICWLLIGVLIGNAYADVVVGDLRVQPLSPTLVRLEAKGKSGFEDRVTFTVVDRKWPGLEYKTSERNGETIVETPQYVVRIRDQRARVETPGGEMLYEFGGKLPGPSFLPSPGHVPHVFALADSPRIVPPSWGATPGAGTNSGWDVENDAADVYVFIPGQGGYEQLRHDFLKLTGATELPPLFTFGLMHSRYHPYSDRDALEVIDTYRKKRIPVDVFVVDTDWRVGASHGYGVNTNLFPDMEGFLREAHQRNVHVMFNDHPEPVGPALDSKELQYRYDGLTSLLKIGADVWWYDRNWHTHLNEPAPGIRKEVWGMRLYHDITQRYRPERRPLIMSNVQGIDNGRRNYAPHPAAHRYPFWWTGDTPAEWESLQKGIANAVDYGVISLQPYLSEDLTGHFMRPSPELYARFFEFGALSPITRLHCTRGETRDPWAFGDEDERIVTDYTRLRYRLMPTIYAAARRAYDDGTPLLRRCDLYWPEFAEATNNMEYLFGDDILVAPIIASPHEAATIPAAFLRTPDDKPGLRGEYFNGMEPTGTVVVARVDSGIDFRWEDGAPDPKLPVDFFSTRWTGTLGPIPETGDYTFSVRVDDGVRLWLDDKLIIDKWTPHPVTTFEEKVKLEKGRSYKLRMEYFEYNVGATCALGWSLPSQANALASRQVWIPPGEWLDAWTGAKIAGPKTITVSSPLWHTPMYVRAGGVVLSTVEMQYTSERPWDTIVVDAFIPEKGPVQTKRTLYEDDGITPDYQRGASAVTEVSLAAATNSIRLTAGTMQGGFAGQLKERTWVFRAHLPKGRRLAGATLNAAKTEVRYLKPTDTGSALPFRGEGVPPGKEAGDVVEVRANSRPTNEPLTLVLTLSAP